MPKVRDVKQEARELLRKYPRGLTDKSIAKRLGTHYSTREINELLCKLGDAYIHDWARGSPKFPWRPIWRLADVPQNKPHPEGPLYDIQRP